MNHTPAESLLAEALRRQQNPYWTLQDKDGNPARLYELTCHGRLQLTEYTPENGRWDHASIIAGFDRMAPIAARLEKLGLKIEDHQWCMPRSSTDPEDGRAYRLTIENGRTYETCTLNRRIWVDLMPMLGPELRSGGNPHVVDSSVTYVFHGANAARTAGIIAARLNEDDLGLEVPEPAPGLEVALYEYER